MHSWSFRCRAVPMRSSPTMGSKQPLHEAVGSVSENLLLTILSPQLPVANGAESDDSGSDDSGSESWSHGVPSVRRRRVKVVGKVSVVNVDTVSARTEEAVKLVDAIERDREACKEDPYQFEGDYPAIKDVLDIKENPVYSAAFDEWNRKLTEARVELGEKEKEKTDLIYQIYNIVGFFSVFQGVVLTAVSQLSSGSGEKCRKTWVPVLLSAIAAFVAFFALFQKFAALHKVEGLFDAPRAQRDYFQERIKDLLTHGKRFRFYKTYPKSSNIVSKRTSKDSWLRCSDFRLLSEDFGCSSRRLADLQGSSVLHNVVLVSVVLFTGVFILSYFVILCDKFLI